MRSIIAVLCCASLGYADLVITLEERGGDVVVDAAGSLDDFSKWEELGRKQSFQTDNHSYGDILPNMMTPTPTSFPYGGFGFRIANTPMAWYRVSEVASNPLFLSRPEYLGPGLDYISTTTVSGDAFFLGWSFSDENVTPPNPDTWHYGLGVSESYQSGDPLASSMTFENHTFDSLGISTGTYEWSWPTTTGTERISMQVGTSSVPEPSSFAMVAIVAIGFGIRFRRFLLVNQNST